MEIDVIRQTADKDRFYLQCDRCGSTFWPGIYETPEDCRTVARRLGWATDDLDLCHDCKPVTAEGY